MKSSISDKPISKIDDDRLEIRLYIEALSQFILESETPLTIGLQGEWGTGKTSMMNLIREKIIEAQVPTCWLNTWEHSLFTDPVETTPKMLRAMMSNLQNDNSNKEFLDEKDTTISQTFTDIGTKLATIANQAVEKKIGVNLQPLINGKGDNGNKNEISALKSSVEVVLKAYIDSEKNPHKRVVFFIDDLDRIEPSRAVEILEALKNLLDFDGCVFVLAIDYEVVVTGLKVKFGERKDQNDREFRSFFDKIIQVPFRIPTEKYEFQNFLYAKFKSFGTIEITDQFITDCEFFVKNTLGMNPRALKRQLNLYNLSSRILRKDIEEIASTQNENDDVNKQSVELALFAVICIQAADNELFQAITAKADDLSKLKEPEVKGVGSKFENERTAIYNKFREKKWLKENSALAEALGYAAVTSVGELQIKKKARKEIELDEHFSIHKISESQRDIIKKFKAFVQTLQSPLAIKATDSNLSFYDQKNRDKNRGVVCYLRGGKDGVFLGLKTGKGQIDQRLENLRDTLQSNGFKNVNFKRNSKDDTSLQIEITENIITEKSKQLADMFAEHKEIYADEGWYKWSKNAE